MITHEASALERRLSFANGGPAQTGGLIVMTLSDEVAPDLDTAAESIVVLFNATPMTWSEAALRGRRYKLHKTQRTSDDELTTTAQFVPGQGRFRVPPRTTAVFVED